MYLDYRTQMIGTKVTDTEGVAAAILAEEHDLAGWDGFVRTNLGACDGRASDRFAERFTPAAMAPRPAAADAVDQPRATLPADVSRE
jgi:hypothetical protein